MESSVKSKILSRDVTIVWIVANSILLTYILILIIFNNCRAKKKQVMNSTLSDDDIEDNEFTSDASKSKIEN